MSDQDTSQPSSEAPLSIALDNPVSHEKDDKLGRVKSAQSFAQSVLSFDVSQGLVVGVLGPWGSGKTTFINFAKTKFKESDITVLDFNPWMFSGTEQLVQSFFSELSAQLNIRSNISNLSKHLKSYGELFVSGIAAYPPASWLLLFKKVPGKIGEWIESKYGGMSKRREKVETVLRKQEKPIVVVLDDIDRLTTSEIRDVFKLVRLTANFPNIIYILAFDRERVENALSEQNVPGRAYLEKILQFGVDLPMAPISSIHAQLFETLGVAVQGTSITEKFSENWPDIFSEIIYPLIKNMRDVRRYGAAVSSSLRDLDGQVALVDVLAMEAVRIFMPDVFLRLYALTEALTTPSSIGFGGYQESPVNKERIDNLLIQAENKSEVVKALINRCFPAATRHIGNTHYGPDYQGRWLRERRVAHKDILSFYFERVLGDGLRAFNYAEEAWEVMHDAAAFNSYMNSLEAKHLEDTIRALRSYEDKFAEEHVIPGACTLFNILPNIAKRQGRSLFDINSRFIVTTVVYRLVRSLQDPIKIEETVRNILPNLETFSSKLLLIEIIGHREDVGHKLVPEDVAAQFEKDWRSEFRGRPSIDIVKEHELLRVFYFAKIGVTEDESPMPPPDDPILTGALLLSAVSESASQPIDSRAIKRYKHLSWDILVDIFDDEETLKKEIEALKAINAESVLEVLSLADKYLSGWRPSRWGSDDD